MLRGRRRSFLSSWCRTDPASCAMVSSTTALASSAMPGSTRRMLLRTLTVSSRLGVHTSARRRDAAASLRQVSESAGRNELPLGLRTCLGCCYTLDVDLRQPLEP